MGTPDLEDDIDSLAIDIEEKIQENEKYLDSLPTFAPKSANARKLKRKVRREK